MLDRLEESFKRLARFSADIAHELRTPVNNLRREAEVALGKSRSAEGYREVLGSCLEECARLSRIIDSLLYEAAAAEAGVTLRLICSDGMVANLDRTLFQRAVGNLVANALAHTPAGGIVTVAAGREDGAVTVNVTDTGCGIPEAHLPHVFDRFYRVDDARSTATGGVGLGLAIVKTIAGLHHGSAMIKSEVGKGTRVTLAFPYGGSADARKDGH
jgi:two-component system heavy metal sensor histidine kinase CusS